MMAPSMLLNGLVLFSKLTYSKMDLLCIELLRFNRLINLCSYYHKDIST